MGDISAELRVTGGQHDLLYSWPPPLVPTNIKTFLDALSVITRDLRSHPLGVLEVHLLLDPFRLEFVHRGSEPFSFYGFEESKIGAAIEVHLGGAINIADIPSLIHTPIEVLSNPSGARVDNAGLVELRPGEKLTLLLSGDPVNSTAVIRVCYPRRDEEGCWFPDEGWVIASKSDTCSQST
jgi:hypothetical protein